MDSTTADNGQRGSAIVRAAFHDRSLAAPLPARLAEPVAAIRQAHQRLRFLVVAEAHTAARVARVLGCDGIVADEADTGILAGFVPILVPTHREHRNVPLERPQQLPDHGRAHRARSRVRSSVRADDLHSAALHCGAQMRGMCASHERVLT